VAQAFVVQVVTSPVTDTAGVRTAIESFATEPNGGPGILSPAVQHELIRLTEQYRLPTITGFRTFVADGALMSYDSDVSQNVRGLPPMWTASWVHEGRRIAGALSDHSLACRQAWGGEAIGLTIPAFFLPLADGVIK
jgi:hypothetical protein